MDLVEKPQWDDATQRLTAVANVIGNEPYRVAIALNGYKPLTAHADQAKVRIAVRGDHTDLADLVIESDANARINWSVTFDSRSSR